jgi:RNA polymerase sigma-70 factor (family 1)
MDEQQAETGAGGRMTKEEFESMFLSQYEILCSLAYQITRDKHIAEDIVQDFFYHFWNAHRDKVIMSSFAGYAFKAIRNRSLDFLRNNNRVIHEEELADDRAENAGEELQHLEAKEALYLRLELEIMNLPEQRRRIFLMSTREGLKYREIAEQLDLSINTVKTHIKLAYQQLRTSCLPALLIFFIKITHFIHPLVHLLRL